MPIEVSALRDGDRGAISQQHAALSLEVRIGLLLDPVHFVNGPRSVGVDVERVGGYLGVWQMLGDHANERRRKVDADRVDPGGRAVHAGSP